MTVQRWGSSGLAALTGLATGRPDFSRAGVLTRAQSVADAFDVDAATLLAGRAGQRGFRRRGRVSAGGATRLVRTADDWCAVTLARAEDADAVSALVYEDVIDDPWQAVTRWATTRPAAEVVSRATLLDIPVSRLAETPAAEPLIQRIGDQRTPSRRDRLVVDLSSMWAGPLCGQLLRGVGVHVVKVESPDRPDGTRAGDPQFFDWMNTGKLCYSFDFDDPALRRLLAAADVVIEASRPGALTRHGLGPRDVPARAGRIWLRISGHGSRSTRVAFGDDAAVAGGLVGVGPVFCGDAIADPLTGLEAARAVTDSLTRGGGELIDVSMAAVAATYAAVPLNDTEADVTVAQAQPPAPVPRASAQGADNPAVDQLVAQRTCAPC